MNSSCGGCRFMNFKRVLSCFGHDGCEFLSEKHWKDSQAVLTSGDIFFLKQEYIVDSCKFLNLPQDITKAAILASEKVNNDFCLRELAWYFHYCLFHASDYPQNYITSWPPLISTMKKETGVFYLLVIMSGLEKVRKYYQSNLIPLAILKDTMSDIKRKLEEYQRENGIYGLDRKQVKWLPNHFYGKIFQLGRLQFEVGTFKEKIRVFRHIDKKTVVSLSGNGVYYRKDGYVNGAGSVYDRVPWMAQLQFGDNRISGYPIAPSGRVIREKIVLALSSWEQVLAIGDRVLHIHIPAGSPLSLEQCKLSFNLAVEFFSTYFPQDQFKAFVCNSWLLDNQFQNFLPQNSNIVKFQKELFLFSIVSNQNDILKAIFGNDYSNFAKIEPKTTLHKVDIQHLLKGNHFRGGAGFLLLEDLEQGYKYYEPTADVSRSALPIV